MPSSTPPLTTASDLAEYAYCPRAHWYRHHPPPEGATADAVDGARRGTRSHQRQLRGERHRAERAGWYWALVVVGLALLVGGVAWWH